MPETARPLPLIRLAAAAALLAAFLAALRGSPLRPWLRDAVFWLSALGPRGFALFLLLYVAACVLVLPAVLLTLAAGAAYGPAIAVPLVSAGATAGATAAFLTGRYLLRERIRRRFADDPRYRTLDRAVSRGGWRIVLLARLSPVIPFSMVNYALGLTGVSAREYVAASWLGMLPGIGLYVYLGALAGQASGAAPGKTPLQRAFLGVGLAATAAGVAYGTRLARREWRELSVAGTLPNRSDP